MKHTYEIGIISAVTTRSPPVNDARRRRSCQPERMHVGHHIMSPFLLLLGRNRKLLILYDLVGLHLLDCLITDVEAKLFLTLGQPHPELTPSGESVTRAKEILHLFARVPRVQGVLVGVVVRHCAYVWVSYAVMVDCGC